MATLKDLQKKLRDFGNEVRGLSGKKIIIRPDSNGMIDRQCPSCSKNFKIGEDALTRKLDEKKLYCPFCRHSAPESNFLTKKHTEQIKNAIHSSMANNWNNNKSISDTIVTLTSTPATSDIKSCLSCDAHYSSVQRAEYCPCCGNKVD